jgi:hypothetical protein
MTTERYKVLGAVLALKEFTVADLATFSGVKATTVRTVLSREPNLVVEVGKQETGLKGGQYTRHRVREEALQELRAELHELYRQIGSYVDSPASEKETNKGSKYSPPMAMLAAEEALLRRFPKMAEREQKIQLIDFVRTVRAKLSLQANELPQEASDLGEHRDFHLSALQALIDLASVETICAEKPQLTAYPVRRLRSLFFSLAQWGSRLGESDYASTLVSRFLTSPIPGIGEPSPEFVTPESTLISALESDGNPHSQEWIEELRGLTSPIQQDVLAVDRASLKDRIERAKRTPVSAVDQAPANRKKDFTPGETSLSIGIETVGGIVTRMIPRHSRLPARHREVFSTANDNQTAVEVALYQGERPLARDNYKLGVFRLDGIPAARRGVPQIEVTFEIDAREKLSVVATNLESGNRQAITLAVAPELSVGEIERMLRDAEDHAEEDRTIEERIQLRNRADNAVAYAEKSLREYANSVPDELRRKIEVAIGETKQAVEEGDSEAVDAVIAELAELHQQLYLSQASQQALPQYEAKSQAQAQSSFPDYLKARG